MRLVSYVTGALVITGDGIEDDISISLQKHAATSGSSATVTTQLSPGTYTVAAYGAYDAAGDAAARAAGAASSSSAADPPDALYFHQRSHCGASSVWKPLTRAALEACGTREVATTAATTAATEAEAEAEAEAEDEKKGGVTEEVVDPGAEKQFGCDYNDEGDVVSGGDDEAGSSTVKVRFFA